MDLMIRDNSDLSKPVKREKKPRRIKQVSSKQRKHMEWIERVARPYLIATQGDICNCCKLAHYPHDVDHILGKGSHIELKEDLNNLQILGRFPCHRNKTDNIPCYH